MQLVVYRVAQEALVNAARHSGASHVDVTLERCDGRVRLVVADDGSGFAFAQQGKGLGLDGMRERALLVGGALQVDSRPGKGTTVRLEVPAGERAVDRPAGDNGDAAAPVSTEAA